MTLGYDKPIYILAFDHRSSFQKMLGITAKEPSPEEIERTQDAKGLIFEGFQSAITQGVAKENAGVLTDEQYGSEVARKAKADSVNLAMPVEKSGQNEFDFEYGDQFGEHIEDFNPDFSKVLVRYNPAGDPDMNKGQTERLRRLSDWLHERERKFLFELLVPAEEDQLASVEGDVERYDTELRPGLMKQSIKQLLAGGVDPDIWKIEGIDSRDECSEIADLVRGDGKSGVSCVVLGRGADDMKVDEWLRAAAGLDGYIGFAIGRSIFGDSIKGYGSGSINRVDAVNLVAQKYKRFIDVYEKG